MKKMSDNYFPKKGVWQRVPLMLLAFLFSLNLVFGQGNLLEVINEDNEQETIVTIDLKDYQEQLKKAPMESGDLTKSKSMMISLPNPDGMEQDFHVVGSPVMTAEFHAVNPEIKTYKIFNEETNMYGRLVLSPSGLHSLVFTEYGSYYIDPVDKSNPVDHKVFYNDSDELQSLVECGFDPALPEFAEDVKAHKQRQQNLAKAFAANGATKRTYNIAITTTGEFYQDADFGDNNLGDANTSITNVVADLSTKYELELAVTFTGVVVNAAIYTNPATDPFDAAGNRTQQAANTIGMHYAQGAYDFGHCLHATASGGSGVAGLGVICNNNAVVGGGFGKGRGWSGGSNHQTLVNAILWHEVGHQFDMPHTFNGTGSSCSAAISNGNAYEIGSGTTIMSYNGNCQADNNIPAPESGTAQDYFHTKSLEKALNYIAGTGSCAATAASGNAPPTVNANTCGGPYTIPQGTPFKLVGSGNDTDGDQIYYTWEQIDEDGVGTPTQGLIGAAAAGNASAPLFRSYPPNTSPIRYFPNMELIKANNYASSFEPLPTVARTLNFSLTGRDLKTDRGGIHSSDVAVTVSGSGPFQLTAPNGGGAPITAGTAINVSWNHNGANAFCTNVNIKLSVDGGNSYPYLLAAATPIADGSENVTIPASVPNTTTARVMVECADNTCVVFFDISDADFSITSTCAAEASNICPATAMTVAAGPAANLTLAGHIGGNASGQTFTIDAGDPTSSVINRTSATDPTCQVSGFTNIGYETMDFIVLTTGSYNFSNTMGGQIMYSVFEANGLNLANGCTGNTFIGANSHSSISWSTAVFF